MAPNALTVYDGLLGRNSGDSAGKRAISVGRGVLGGVNNIGTLLTNEDEWTGQVFNLLSDAGSTVANIADVAGIAKYGSYLREAISNREASGWKRAEYAVRGVGGLIKSGGNLIGRITGGEKTRGFVGASGAGQALSGVSNIIGGVRGIFNRNEDTTLVDDLKNGIDIGRGIADVAQGSKKIATAAKMKKGVKIGAKIGSIIPGKGTLIGAGAGLLIGGAIAGISALANNERVREGVGNAIAGVRNFAGGLRERASGLRERARGSVVGEAAAGALIGGPVGALVGLGVGLNRRRRAQAMANGGILTGPKFCMVGEDGPEAIIPLSGKRRERGLALWEHAGRAMGAIKGNGLAAVRDGLLSRRAARGVDVNKDKIEKSGKTPNKLLSKSPKSVQMSKLKAEKATKKAEVCINSINISVDGAANPTQTVDAIANQLAARLQQCFTNMPLAAVTS